MKPVIDFASALDVGASFRNGKREIHWRWVNTGLAGCQPSEMVWLSALELEPWRCEPLRIHPSRRTSAGRTGFPDAARKKIVAATLAHIGGGFDAIWRSLWSPGDGSHERESAERERKRASWWLDRLTLVELVADGVATMVPMGAARISMPNGYQQAATSIVVDGEAVGFLTNDGDMAPSWGWPNRY